MHEAGRMRATERDMCKADKGRRPALSDVVLQDEAVNGASDDMRWPAREKM